jgi:Tol biopolymer transport system component
MADRQPIKWDDRGVVSILETIDIDTGNRTVLMESEDLIEAPNWTSDGRYLVYNSHGRIHTFDLSTKEIRQIDSGQADRCNNDHVLSPGGRHIAVSHNAPEDRKSRIYILPLSGGQPVPVTPLGPSYLHGWSPDGSTLAYCAERSGQFDIYIIPAAGGEESQLTDLPGLDDGPEYSPCGRYIWFCSTRSGLMQVWRMERDGSDPVQMTFDESNNWFPHISPDGKWVSYITYRKGDVEPNAHPANKDVEIRLMPAEGSGYKTLAKLFGGQGTINVNSWCPDSKAFAFVSYRTK